MKYTLNEDNLNKVFDLEEEKNLTVIKADDSSSALSVSKSNFDSFPSQENAFQNLEKVKQNQFEVIEKVKPLLDASIEISQMSQHPQTIAATASLIGSITNAAELIAKIETNLLKLQQSSNKKEQANVNIDKAVFIGSTAELQKEILKTMIEKADSTDV